MDKTWLRTLAGISALAASTLVMTQTAAIDFDPVAPPLIQPTYDEGGYRLSVSQGDVVVHDFFTPGNSAMQPTFGFASLSYLTVQAIDGGLFAVVSIGSAGAAPKMGGYSGANHDPRHRLSPATRGR